VEDVRFQLRERKMFCRREEEEEEDEKKEEQ